MSPSGGPVVKTTGGSTTLATLSISTWAHYAGVTAVEWGAGVGSLWYQVHVNRMTECGISGGTPVVPFKPFNSRSAPVDAAGTHELPVPVPAPTPAPAPARGAARGTSLAEAPGRGAGLSVGREGRAAKVTRRSGATPATRAGSNAAATAAPPPRVSVPACRVHQKLGLPLVRVTGSGSFYNFYNEDAMGAMVAGDYQLPDYRHILVVNTTGVRFYHFNPEHAVADANAEFRGSSNISVYGTKSEGHSATLWVRNCTDVFHTGHGGNAFPLPCGADVCPTWRPSPCACDWTAGAPSLFRVDGCAGNCRCVCVSFVVCKGPWAFEMCDPSCASPPCVVQLRI